MMIILRKVDDLILRPFMQMVEYLLAQGNNCDIRYDLDVLLARRLA